MRDCVFNLYSSSMSLNITLFYSGICPSPHRLCVSVRLWTAQSEGNSIPLTNPCFRNPDQIHGVALT